MTEENSKIDDLFNEYVKNPVKSVYLIYSDCRNNIRAKRIAYSKYPYSVQTDSKKNYRFYATIFNYIYRRIQLPNHYIKRHIPAGYMRDKDYPELNWRDTGDDSILYILVPVTPLPAVSAGSYIRLQRRAARLTAELESARRKLAALTDVKPEPERVTAFTENKSDTDRTLHNSNNNSDKKCNHITENKSEKKHIAITADNSATAMHGAEIKSEKVKHGADDNSAQEAAANAIKAIISSIFPGAIQVNVTENKSAPEHATSDNKPAPKCTVAENKSDTEVKHVADTIPDMNKYTASDNKSEKERDADYLLAQLGWKLTGNQSVKNHHDSENKSAKMHCIRTGNKSGKAGCIHASENNSAKDSKSHTSENNSETLRWWANKMGINFVHGLPQDDYLGFDPIEYAENNSVKKTDPAEDEFRKVLAGMLKANPDLN